MAKSATITLTTAGTDTGPFNLLSDVDSYVTPFETSVAKSSLVAGYTTNLVPDLATIVRVQSSNSFCTNSIDLAYSTTTTTSTTTVPPTTTTTTTVPPTTTTTSTTTSTTTPPPTTTTTTSTTTSTTTPPPTTTTTSTTTTTTTVAYYVWLGPVSTFGTSGSACSGYNTARSYYSPQNFMTSGVTQFFDNTALTIPVETTGNYLPLTLNGVGTVYTAIITAGTVSFYTSCP